MTEDQEIIAKALEIAVMLTQANETWLKRNPLNLNDIFLDEPLFTALKDVICVINAGNIIAGAGGTGRVFSGDNRRDADKF